MADSDRILKKRLFFDLFGILSLILGIFLVYLRSNIAIEGFLDLLKFAALFLGVYFTGQILSDILSAKPSESLIAQYLSSMGWIRRRIEDYERIRTLENHQIARKFLLPGLLLIIALNLLIGFLLSELYLANLPCFLNFERDLALQTLKFLGFKVESKICGGKWPGIAVSDFNQQLIRNICLSDECLHIFYVLLPLSILAYLDIQLLLVSKSWRFNNLVKGAVPIILLYILWNWLRIIIIVYIYVFSYYWVPFVYDNIYIISHDIIGNLIVFWGLVVSLWYIHSISFEKFVQTWEFKD